MSGSKHQHSPGVYPDISNTDYHQGEGISSTQIKVIATKTPLHYYDRYIAEDRDQEVKDLHGPLAIGTLFHSMLLEPDKDPTRETLIVGSINRRSKAGKEAYAEAAEEAKKTQRNIVTQEEYYNVVKMVEAARKQPLFTALFTGGVAESSCYWIDEDTGIMCKCRPDYLHPDNIIVDLKSCISASEEDAGRAAHNFGYFISAAFYLDGVAAATGKPTESFIFAFMEKTRPYATAPYVITEEDLTLGRILYKQGLKKIKECTASGRWPGYTTDIIELEIPAWARKKIRTQIGKEA